ncbi:Do family serine endopeptidase [bacterium]|nr:Do family serine endopeptidase [bacterium]
MATRYRWIILLLVCMQGGMGATDRTIETLKETGRAFNRVAHAALPAVVSISTSQDHAPPRGIWGDLADDLLLKRFFLPTDSRNPEPQPARGLGSGVIVSAEGHLITNYHVIKGADDINVTLHDQRTVTATLLGSDPKTDLAILKIDAPRLVPIAWGNSDDIEVGDWAIAIGSPFGLSGSMTVGIISAKGRSDTDIADYTDFIQTDAAINRGNSGGALLSIDGNLIGINTAIFSASGGGSNGIGFAIPSNVAKKILTDIRTKGSVSRGWLGVVIQPMTPGLQEELKWPHDKGALVGDVVPNSPADRAGIKRRDIILSLNGQPIREHTDIKWRLGQLSAGDPCTIDLWRQGKTQTVTVTIGEPPHDLSKGSYDRLGLIVDDITPALRSTHRIKRDRGVVISRIQPNGIASHAGLKVGSVVVEVNRRPIHNLAEYDDALQSLGHASRVMIAVASGLYAELYVLPLK